MLFIIAANEIYRIELTHDDKTELISFLNEEKSKYDSCGKKAYSINYKKEEDELFYIENYKTEMSKTDEGKKIIDLLDKILSSSTIAFPKANLITIPSIELVIFSLDSKLYIQSSSTTKLIDNKGRKLLINTRHKINNEKFLSIGNKINAVYDGKVLCLSSTYGLSFLGISQFVKELTTQEIHSKMPSHIECAKDINFNRATAKMFSLALQTPEYFSKAHLTKAQTKGLKLNPQINIPYNNGKLKLPSDTKEIGNILSVVLDMIFQSNYNSAELVKANSVERIKK